MDHYWHLFDAERGYEVKRKNKLFGSTEYHVRKTHSHDEYVVLTEDEFEQLRADGPNPKGLD